jgi:hypothetical protein
MRLPRIELGSTAWKATMLTITPETQFKNHTFFHLIYGRKTKFSPSMTLLTNVSCNTNVMVKK